MGTKATTPKNLCWIRVRVKIVSSAQKLGMIDKWCQDQSYFFWQEGYMNKGNNHENLFCVGVLVKMNSVAQ
jgi:hypothetical protein